MSVSAKITLDTRRLKKKNEKYPVKLLVTNDSKPQRYQTIFDLSKDDFSKLSASRINNELQETREKLKEIVRTAEEAIKKLIPFSFEQFEKVFILNNSLFKQRKFKTKVELSEPIDFDYTRFKKRMSIFGDDHSKAGTISVTFFSYIKKLIRENRVGTAFLYHCSYVSLLKFKGNVQFTHVTVCYLKQYEQWMLIHSNSKATIGIYLRSVRAIFNEAIHDGVINRDSYPFGRRKYQIPTGKNVKKALKLSDIELIYNYIPCCDAERKARDFWMLYYLSNGANPKDIALWKYKNIIDGYIVFERAKTESTARNDPKTITVYISEEIKEIIERWGNKDRSPNNYIFPILRLGLSPLEQFDLSILFIYFVNKRMRKICDNLGINKKATTIVTRHTFSTVMKNSGASTEFIQEALGHTNKKTTENYLDSFEKEIKREFASKLTLFKYKALEI